MKALLAVAALAVLLAAPSSLFAKNNRPENNKKFQQNHPRRTEVLKRDDRQSKRANNATKNGKLTKGQDAKIQGQERKIRAQEQADAKKNGGHITKGEQRQLNKEENGVNHEINHDEHKDSINAAGHPEDTKNFEKNHGRRTEVLKRTDNQNNQVNKALTDKKMTYQQGSQIKKEDQSIRRQEQADAKANGGHITKDEQNHLNKEENHVEGQIKADEAKDAAPKP
jgi:predicted  nucleic acid-binding Zn-ribbon protein